MAFGVGCGSGVYQPVARAAWPVEPVVASREEGERARGRTGLEFSG